MGTTGWGFFMQGSDQQIEIDELGRDLSLAIHCPVHYPAYNKNLFECECGVIFPVYVLKGHTWEWIRNFHEQEKKIAHVGGR